MTPFLHAAGRRRCRRPRHAGRDAIAGGRIRKVTALGVVVAAAILGSVQAANAATPPGAPTNLQATVSGTSVTLTWTNAAGAQGVNAYRDVTKKTWVGGYPNPAPTTFTDTNVPTGNHSYAVADYNGAGQGPLSNVVNVAVGATTGPTVTGLSPTSGPVAGGTAVTITGTNLSGVTAVKFGTKAATTFSGTSATSVSATSPAGSGTVDVTVTTPGGTSAISSGDKFTYVPAPTVTNLSPRSGPAAGGTGVSVTGTNFTGATGVTFGATASPFTEVNATTITTTSPAGSGTVDVTVTTPGGTSATSSADKFTYAGVPTPAPRITKISPSSGSSGTKITITGTNLTGTTVVDFGPSNPGTQVTVVNATTVTAGAPSGSGTVDVQVTTPAGTSIVQTLDWFTYKATLTLNPTQLTVPDDGAMKGAVTATLTSAGKPAANVAVTATESTPTKSSHSITGCTTATNGTCLIFTDADSTQESGTITVKATGFATGTAHVAYASPGTAPTGLTMTVTNGNGASASPLGTDAYSDGNHYFVQETSGFGAQYENTPAEAVVSVTMVNGSAPLTSGTEPYAVSWTLKNTGANTLFIDAIANVAEMPYTNVICTKPTQTDPKGSLSCTPSSYDLDFNPHFSNPANPGKFGLGVNNGTMAPQSGGQRSVAAGTTITFTTYMVGQNNNAEVVLDSPTNLPVSATIGAHLSHDPAFSKVGGSTFGNTVQSAITWAKPASGSSVSGSLTASNPTAPGEPDSAHDWVVLDVGGALTLVNFDQTSSQSYSANGGPVTEAVFESDLATATSISVTNYGATGQANALTG